MNKKKLATIWLGGCSGCHMSVLDMDERLLDLARVADIVKSPLVDGKVLPEVDVALIEGAVASDEHIRELQHVRRQARVVVALGDCAVTGNVTALRNFLSKEEVLRCSYQDAASQDAARLPDAPELQRLVDRVMPLHEVVDVDCHVPGCPPSADTIFYVLNELLHDRAPNLQAEGRLRYG